MNRIALLLVLAASVSMAQTTPKSTTTAPSATTAHRTTAASSAVKLPPGVPVVHGIVKTAFALRYEDYKIGTGKLAEPGKLYKVHYTGWLASDGTKFDSSYDHKAPVLDKDGKPENDADGKPKLGEAQPLTFPQGRGRLIAGWDQGFEGMKVGGKRRLFIPYQLAYGAMGRPPKIPAKSDLIFDVELVDVSDMPAPGGPGMPGMPGGRPMPRPGMPGAPGAPGAPGGAPPTGTSPVAPPTPPPSTPKPGDPTAPTVAPNSAPAPAPSTPPATPPPAAAPDKPANPAQPN